MASSELFSVKTARFIAITIFLGAIGSGAWEWILKPGLTSLSDFGLNVATLGIKSFKDSLYKEVALGFHEESSVRLYLAVFGVFPCFLLGVLTGFLHAQNRTSNSGTSIIEKIVIKGFRPAIILVIFLLVFSIVQANQMAYINRSITHFNVLLQVTSPYITEHQRSLYQSRFAQVASKDDYVKVVNDLAAICHLNNLRVPEFSVW